jgi:hypothetical protein
VLLHVATLIRDFDYEFRHAPIVLTVLRSDLGASSSPSLTLQFLILFRRASTHSAETVRK